jgi:hypothetical protein
MKEATSLRLTVVRGQTKTVDLSFPAVSARWLLDLIPNEVVRKIEASGVLLEDIQKRLASSEKLTPQKIFMLEEPNRTIHVWLE